MFVVNLYCKIEGGFGNPSHIATNHRYPSTTMMIFNSFALLLCVVQAISLVSGRCGSTLTIEKLEIRSTVDFQSNLTSEHVSATNVKQVNHECKNNLSLGDDFNRMMQWSVDHAKMIYNNTSETLNDLYGVAHALSIQTQAMASAVVSNLQHTASSVISNVQQTARLAMTNVSSSYHRTAGSLQPSLDNLRDKFQGSRRKMLTVANRVYEFFSRSLVEPVRKKLESL